MLSPCLRIQCLRQTPSTLKMFPELSIRRLFTVDNDYVTDAATQAELMVDRWATLHDCALSDRYSGGYSTVWKRINERLFEMAGFYDNVMADSKFFKSSTPDGN